jgi:hypothetical protein
MIPCISTKLWKPWNTNGCLPLNTTGWQTCAGQVYCQMYGLFVTCVLLLHCSWQHLHASVNGGATFSGSSWQLLCHMQAGPGIIKISLHCSNQRAQLHTEMTLEVFGRVIILVIWQLLSGHLENSRLKNYKNEMTWSKKIHKNHDNCQPTVIHPYYLPVNRDQYLGVQDIQVSKQCFPKEKNWNRTEYHAMN